MTEIFIQFVCMPMAMCSKILVKFVYVVFKLCEWTDRQTDRETDTRTHTQDVLIMILCTAPGAK